MRGSYFQVPDKPTDVASQLQQNFSKLRPTMPAATHFLVHAVHPRDHIDGLVLKYGVSKAEIKMFNDLPTDNIHCLREIKIPKYTPVATDASAPAVDVSTSASSSRASSNATINESAAAAVPTAPTTAIYDATAVTSGSGASSGASSGTSVELASMVRGVGTAVESPAQSIAAPAEATFATEHHISLAEAKIYLARAAGDVDKAATELAFDRGFEQ